MRRLKPPFVVAVVVEKSAFEAQRSLRAAFREGADAAELNLAPLTSMPRRLFSSARPIYTSCRRAAFMGIYGAAFAKLPVLNDEARMERQLAALELGSAGLDIEADTFAQSADEWSQVRRAVVRQQRLSELTRRQGCTTIFSWHPPRKLTLPEARRRARLLRDRGADFVKIVEVVRSREEALDSLRISLTLREELNFPFVFLALGREAVRFRPLMTRLGSAYLLARPSRGANRLPAQPTIATARAVLAIP